VIYARTVTSFEGTIEIDRVLSCRENNGMAFDSRIFALFIHWCSGVPATVTRQLSVGWRQDRYFALLLTVIRAAYLARWQWDFPLSSWSWRPGNHQDFIHDNYSQEFYLFIFQTGCWSPNREFQNISSSIDFIKWIWDHSFIVVLLSVVSIVFIRCQHLNLLLATVWQLN
jgi:hypothetical protein